MAFPLTGSFRARYLAAAVACFALIGYALYVQYGMLMMPCPLCILQRIAFAALGLVFLAGGLHAPAGRAGRLAYAVLALVPAGAGAGVAARHVWLQSLPPDEVPVCTQMALDYMVEMFGPLGALGKVLQGSGECAKIDWTFLGFSMPAWTLLWYVGLGIFAVWAALRSR